MYSTRHRHIASTITSNKSIPGTVGKCEMDSHADTCCAGANFIMLTPTGAVCDVSPYDSSYEPRKNLPIATCATVYTMPNGIDILLVGHEMIYFGNLLPNSLINPNQIRHSGGSVQDDYTRSDADFGITLEDLFVPFAMQGTITYFETRAPSPEELDNLPQFVFTSDAPWNPKDICLRRPPPTPCVQLAGAAWSQPESYVTDGTLTQVSSILVEPQLRHRAISSVIVNCDTYDNIITPQANASLQSNERHSTITPEHIARTWKIGLKTAQQTLRCTTQKGIRTALHPIQRRYRVNHLDLHKKRLNTTFHLDEMFSKVKSIRGNVCATVFTDGKFTAVYPLPSKADAGQTLNEFAQDVGIPEFLVTDLAGELSGPHTDFMKYVRHLRINTHWAKKGRHQQNHKAEREIGILKQRWRRRMDEMNIPQRLWDYGIVYESELLSRISRGHDDCTGYERITGQTPDISEWLDFSFYDLVWYHNGSKPDLTDNARQLGRWLGISHCIGSDLTYWVLTESGKVVSCSTVQHVTMSEQKDSNIKPKIDRFNDNIMSRLDDVHFTDDSIKHLSPYIQDVPLEENTEVTKGVIPSDHDYGDFIVQDIPDTDDAKDYDKLIGAELCMEIGGEPLTGRVIKRSKGSDGQPKGKAHKNPLFDSQEYLVEFEDGAIREYTTNLIAENIYSQIDDEGQHFTLIDEIIDHKRDNSALTQENGFIQTKSGNRVPKKTTRGWSFLVNWKDGCSSWVPLKDLRVSNPIEVSEYAVAHNLINEPAFNWWVSHTLRQRKRMIGKIQKKYWRTTHKFGIRLPHSVAEALKIDEETGTDHWAKAIAKETNKVSIAWEARDDLDPSKCRSGEQLIGFTEIRCHMIFDVKMDFTRKARFVAGGHMTDTPSTVTYSSVVSRDSVRLAFLIAALNNIDILACDIGNAYLHAPCKEKIWFLGGEETGNDRGKVLVITRALYGLKSSGAAWHAKLSGTLQEMNFVSTRADPDVYQRLATRPNGTEYYELLLVYVDDILLLSHSPKPTLVQLGQIYDLKDGSIEVPTQYLGAQVYKHSLPDGSWAWAMSSEKFVKNAVQTVEQLLKDDGDGYHLKTTAYVPFPTSYKPELDFSAELNETLTSRYRQLIGILRWAIELGRLDIYLETALLSQYLASPREGHLEAVYHIFAYIKKSNKTAIVFDPKYVNLNESAFSSAKISDWQEIYGPLAEELPPNMPQPKGNPVEITCFVDANHAGNVITRRSHTGIIIFVNNAPILYYSKRQNTVESSTFGSEFVALRIARDMIVSLRYKLRMFGVPLQGPASVLCDNQGVVLNTSVPASALSKKHNAINYHAVREAVTAGILRVGKEDSNTNLADPFTKTLPQKRRYELFSCITYSSMYGKSGPPQWKRPRLIS